MTRKLTLKGRFVSWIDRQDLQKLKVKQLGYIGGCRLIHYAITIDGKIYFIK